MDLHWSGLYRDGDLTIVKHSQDVEPILEHVKTLKSNHDIGSGEMKHAGKIPKSVIENYLIRTGINMHEFMSNPVHGKALLNDPELDGFRIWRGKV